MDGPAGLDPPYILNDVNSHGIHYVRDLALITAHVWFHDVDGIFLIQVDVEVQVDG